MKLEKLIAAGNLQSTFYRLPCMPYNQQGIFFIFIS